MLQSRAFGWSYIARVGIPSALDNDSYSRHAFHPIEALYGVDLKTAGGNTGHSELEFDLAITTRSNHDKGGDVELSVLGIDLKLDKKNDISQSVVSRLRFSVQFSIPEKEMQRVAQQTLKEKNDLV